MTKHEIFIKKQDTKTIVESFELTTNDKTTDFRDIATVRGWLMDELEARNAEAFEAWMLSNEPSPRKFFM